MTMEIPHEVKRHMDYILELHMKEEEVRYKELKEDIDKLRVDMNSFTEAWQQAKGVFTFVKWLAGISGGIATVVLFFKDHIR